MADVVDERPDRRAVAYLLTSAQSAVPQPVDLQGGGLAAIRQFVRQSLTRNPTLRPVVIRLKECRVTETPAAGRPGYVEGRVAVGMAFDAQRAGQAVHLTEYRGAARYIRPASQLAVVEPTLRQALAESLRYLNTWMNTQAGHSAKLATGVQLSFADHPEAGDPDTLFYSPARSLAWLDFQAAPHPGSYAASVFPSFAYQGHTEVVNGVIRVEITLKVFVVRNASWVREGSRDAYSLNHEQRHFDLVKLVSERFRQHLHAVTVDDYNSVIPYQYLLSFQEMNRLEEQYDSETRHGLDQSAQQRWNQHIDDELRTFAAERQSEK